MRKSAAQHMMGRMHLCYSSSAKDLYQIHNAFAENDDVAQVQSTNPTWIPKQTKHLRPPAYGTPHFLQITYTHFIEEYNKCEKDIKL